jgi:hypothetical protein
MKKRLQAKGDIQRDASISAATTITTTDADLIVLQPLTNDVYITFDGSTPTTTNGFLLKKDGIFEHELHSTNTIKVIEATASAEISWQLFVNNSTAE